MRELAQKYGPDAIETLARLMVEADTDAAKISAAKELLDRAYGKSTQPLSNDEAGEFVVRMIERRIVRPEGS